MSPNLDLDQHLSMRQLDPRPHEFDPLASVASHPFASKKGRKDGARMGTESSGQGTSIGLSVWKVVV